VVAVERSDPSRASDPGRPLLDWRAAWDRLGRRASGPVERVRPWGWVFAVVAITAMGCGLLRLLGGLWAIGLCRTQGKEVVDESMIGLVEHLQGAMGCRPTVKLREVADLATPATAGWRRPMLLLPGDWRSWSDAERQAVVAHELAHVIQRDYAAGLMARVAVVLNAHNPLVRWMAGRLELEQELAADALGARFVGGRATYLVALSGLALKQNGRSPSWPARAFLPTQGTLIRRIAMLRNEARTDLTVTVQATPQRLVIAGVLVTLALGVASWKAPVLAGDAPSADRPVDPKVEIALTPVAAERPFETIYVPDSDRGVVAFHPAAIIRRPGGDRLAALIRDQIREFENEVAQVLNVDTKRPGFHRSGGEDIESVVLGFNIAAAKAKPQEDGPERMLHTITSGHLTVRMVAPFDWLGFFRQWNLEIDEVRDGERVYYKVTVPERPTPTIFFYAVLPDDRTLVINEPETIREHFARSVPAAPTMLRGDDWAQASRGLLAVAFDNRDDRFTKPYDRGTGDPEDKAVLELFAGIDRWVVNVPDTPALTIKAQPVPRNLLAAVGVARALNALAELGKVAAAPADAVPNEQARRLYRAFLANLRIGTEGGGVTVGAQHFGTLADVTEVIRAGLAAEAEAAKAPGKIPEGDGQQPKVRDGKP